MAAETFDFQQVESAARNKVTPDCVRQALGPGFAYAGS